MLFIHYIARCIVWCYMITLHEIEPFPRYIRAICEPIQSRRADSGKRHHFPTPCGGLRLLISQHPAQRMDQKQQASSSTYSAHYFSAAFFLLFMAARHTHIYNIIMRQYHINAGHHFSCWQTARNVHLRRGCAERVRAAAA